MKWKGEGKEREIRTGVVAESEQREREGGAEGLGDEEECSEEEGGDESGDG